MKKIFTLLLSVATAISASATDYNEVITVTVNGESTEQTGIVSVTDNGDTFDLTLRNFMLNSEDGAMGVGNIAVNGIKATRTGNAVVLETSQTVTITEGDDQQVPFWMATILPPVPVNLRGVVEDDHLRCYIDIDLQKEMQQTIQVAVGEGYQMLNPGFEAWHTSSGNYMEPNRWHSFESATGSLASMAGHHITRSEDAHSGQYSARIFATSILGIVANGTMTTGRMNAGSMSAANTANHAYLDTSSSDVDGNGDPYFMPLYSRPDSIVAWVKFSQGKANAQNPYATISAVITDGTRYQDPEDKTYTNVVARAKNNTIATTGGQWVRIAAPFVYTEASVEPKAILVTVSTNANAGKGSNNDEVLTDDISLVYNARLTSLKVKGEDVPNFSPDITEYELGIAGDLTTDDITAEADGMAARIVKSVETTADGLNCIVTVYSGDMATATRYTVKVKNTTTVIATRTTQNVAPVCYSPDGRRLKAPRRGTVTIVRQGDGTVKKVL